MSLLDNFAVQVLAWCALIAVIVGWTIWAYDPVQCSECERGEKECDCEGGCNER